MTNPCVGRNLTAVGGAIDFREVGKSILARNVGLTTETWDTACYGDLIFWNNWDGQIFRYHAQVLLLELINMLAGHMFYGMSFNPLTKQLVVVVASATDFTLMAMKMDHTCDGSCAFQVSGSHSKLITELSPKKTDGRTEPSTCG